MKSVAPPLITPDPVTVEETAVSQSRDNAPRPAAADPVPEAEPQAVVHEIEIDDGLLDYGKFERTVAAPGPAPLISRRCCGAEGQEKADPEERAGVKEPTP